MFEHLVEPINKIEVFEIILDRDGAEVSRIRIGSGYGLFRGQSTEEFAMMGSAAFTNIGTLVHYTEDTSELEDQERSHTVPQIGDVCTWRGQEYYISGVSPRPDIYGELVGYNIRCSNG